MFIKSPHVISTSFIITSFCVMKNTQKFGEYMDSSKFYLCAYRKRGKHREENKMSITSLGKHNHYFLIKLTCDYLYAFLVLP